MIRLRAFIGRGRSFRGLERPPRVAASWLFLVLMAAVAAAQVKVEVLADGSKRIFNENQVERARRLSDRLQPVPASSGLASLVERHARLQNLAPRLVQAVIQVESGYNPEALSRVGAMGLMQLMPATAKQLGVRNAYDPEQNVRGGTEYLRRQLDRFSSLPLALAAYNAGPGAVAAYGGSPPYPETRQYVRRVLHLAGLASAAAPLPAPRVASVKTRRPPRRAAIQVSRGVGERFVVTNLPSAPR